MKQAFENRVVVMTPMVFGFLSGLFFFFLSGSLWARELRFSGQASAWTNYNRSLELSSWNGVRYLPQLNVAWGSVTKGLLDLELSANVNGTAATLPFDTLYRKGQLKPYRAWLRFATQQLELRAGLQKINFGSASMIRPLMWFDQLDPRDPLQLTDGVWGLLGRYYFLNNANIWLWLLYGNETAKTWEIGATSQLQPEWGGRIQWPIGKGELALSGHHRLVDPGDLLPGMPLVDPFGESRLGLDGKWDLGAGLWFEAVWISKSRAYGDFTNQMIASTGTDYTFGLGSGLNVTAEQLFFAFNEDPFRFKQHLLFSTLSVNYPLGLSGRLSTMFYYDWTNQGFYKLLTWNYQLPVFTFYVMGYNNPKNYQLPLSTGEVNLFAGTGVQLMIVVNH